MALLSLLYLHHRYLLHSIVHPLRQCPTSVSYLSRLLPTHKLDPLVFNNAPLPPRHVPGVFLGRHTIPLTLSQRLSTEPHLREIQASRVNAPTLLNDIDALLNRQASYPIPPNAEGPRPEPFVALHSLTPDELRLILVLTEGRGDPLLAFIQPQGLDVPDDLIEDEPFTTHRTIQLLRLRRQATVLAILTHGALLQGADVPTGVNPAVLARQIPRILAQITDNTPHLTSILR